MVIPLQIDEALVQEALALSHHPTVTALFGGFTGVYPTTRATENSGIVWDY
ncbi:type II toxin-antitoxin system VapB family antitoxin [[Phormidium] sp. ETS-05]|uniref:type II toxin-antitoxin system VapB family antitoxin n=1 Tax=[Phormidium] sp. ETS-05 TaxID=222819 RepID=UPI001E5D3722|nr:type II toxin-antitoxin system VapB family antitoxin [[Phormidium] sp. ETS-05]